MPDCTRLERTLHFVFGDKRARRSREFFRIDPDLAKAIIELVAIGDIRLTDEQQAIDPEQRHEIERVWSAVNGMDYWTWNGVRLADLRDRFEDDPYTVASTELT